MKKKVGLEEMKAITLDGLKYLREICNNNNITYFLAYGTLLGAVRHKGYIPWDDDIDIWVPRNDYYRLIDTLNKENNDNWEVVSNNVNHDYLFEWAKLSHKKTMITPSRFVNGYIYGVSIDLFPLDDVANVKTIEEARLLMEKVSKDFYFISSKYRGMTNTTKTKFGRLSHMIIFKLASIVLGPFHKQITKYDNNLIRLGNGPKLFTIGCQTTLPVVFRSEWFKESVELEFEGEMYKAPKDYDEILSTLYGDYMQLPPVEKRTTHHFYTALYRQ